MEKINKQGLMGMVAVFIIAFVLILGAGWFYLEKISSLNKKYSSISNKQVQSSTKKEEAILIFVPENGTKYKSKRYGIEINIPEKITYEGSFDNNSDSFKEFVNFFHKNSSNAERDISINTLSMDIIKSEYEDTVALKNKLSEECFVSKCTVSLIQINGINAVDVRRKEERSVLFVWKGFLYDFREWQHHSGNLKTGKNIFGIDQLFTNMKLSTPNPNDFDYTRAYDLSDISVLLELFWDINNRYPKNISELSSSFKVPLDPKTKEAYYYLIEESSLEESYSYQLGASFEERVQHPTNLKYLKGSGIGCNGEVGKYCYLLKVSNTYNLEQPLENDIPALRI